MTGSPGFSDDPFATPVEESPAAERAVEDETPLPPDVLPVPPGDPADDPDTPLFREP